MVALYSELLLDGRLLDDIGAVGVEEVQAGGTMDEVAAEFNKLMGALDYLRYPVTDDSGLSCVFAGVSLWREALRTH